MGEAGVIRRSAAVALLAASILGAAALGACSGKEYLVVNGAGEHTALPAPNTPPPPQAPLQPASAHDTCAAQPLQYLVGKPKTEIPVPEDPSRRRVVCTTCPMTKDFRADRQTILYDEATKLVTQVSCN